MRASRALDVGQFAGRRHHDDVAFLTAGQAMALEYQIESLVPGHVLQIEGHLASHAVAGDQVEAGEIGDDRQYRAHLDVLKIQGHTLAGIWNLLAHALFALPLGDGLRLDGELPTTLGR